MEGEIPKIYQLLFNRSNIENVMITTNFVVSAESKLQSLSP